jgi:aspartate racemase
MVPNRGVQVVVPDLRTFMQERLPEYMVPSAFVVLEAMPLTPNGKINRRGLPAPPAEISNVDRVAAADALQIQLVKIWEDILGKKPIGIRDNFFELGGHSLLAARLMHRVGQALGKTLPLAMLFESPTVEQLALALKQDGWEHHWSSLVPIQASGSQPPFFVVHGVGGNVLGFHELGKRLAPDYPLYGLQSQGLDGKQPCLKSIEDMARHYIGSIRSVQPQLRAQNEEVGLLVLFDTYPGNPEQVSTMGFMKLLLTPSWQHWAHDLPKKAQKWIVRKLRARKVPEFLREVRASNSAAAETYTLKPYGGKATLIRAREKSLRSAGDPHEAWRGLAGNLEVHEMPGDHYDMLVEPQVDDLAKCLKDCVDRGRSEYEAAGASLKVR